MVSWQYISEKTGEPITTTIDKIKAKPKQRKVDWKKYYNPDRTFLYKGTLVVVDYDIKVGICNFCRKVVPFDTPYTILHHESYYDEDPTRDTIESCTGCHIRQHLNGSRIISKQK